MSRRMTHRLLAGGLSALLGAASVAVGPAAALADDHDYLTITGFNLAEPLTVTAEDHPDQYAALRGEVSWLLDRAGNAPDPDEDLLGPQYELVLHVEGEARHEFQLYPLAEGGPRVLRPADQPADEDATEAWFFGRLSLPPTLAEAGVPLTDHPAAAGGGSGGGETGETSGPDDGPLGFVDQWREGMLLTSGVAVAVLAGLASVAFLLRRER